MFYSQIVLSKKGPLGKVWLAAHQEKKLTRPQIFAFDISESIDNIVHPVVPLALRVSGHLLLGVVRIYSRKVKYLMEDAHEASIKINSAFTAAANAGGGGSNAAQNATLDITIANKSRQADHLNIANFGEFHPIAFIEGGFDIPTNLVPEDWDVADEDDEEEALEEQRRQLLEQPQRKRQRRSSEPEDSMEQSSSLITTRTGAGAGSSMSTSLNETSLMERTMQSDLTTSVLQQDWPAFDPDEEEEDSVPEIEATRAAGASFASDRQLSSSSPATKRGVTSPGSSDQEFPQPDDDDQEMQDNNNAMLPFDDDDDEQVKQQASGLSFSVSHDQEDSVDNNRGSSSAKENKVNLIGLDDSHDKSATSSTSAAAKRHKVNVGGLDSSSEEELGGGDDDDEEMHKENEEEDAASQKKPEEEDEGPPLEEAKVEPPKKRRRSSAGRKRKVRRIAMDTEDTRLSAQEIRNHLADASDLEIVQIHPATWLPGVPAARQPHVYETQRARDLLEQAIPMEMYLARPNIADDGSLCPELLNFWLDNTAPLQGKKFPYKLGRKQEEKADEDQQQGEEEEMDVEQQQQQEEEPGSSMEKVEVTRMEKEGPEEVDYSEPKLTEEDEQSFPQPDDEHEEEEVFPLNDDAPMPFEEEEAAAPARMDQEKADDESSVPDESSSRSGVSGLSLGLVNDFGEDFDEEEGEEDDPRQDQGDTLASSSSKWHKHTVKVFEMLHRNMPAADSREPRQLTFDQICNNVSRRTACGVFFELLQLKTWDIIELDQDEAYDNMKISPGLKFEQEPPSAK